MTLLSAVGTIALVFIGAACLVGFFALGLFIYLGVMFWKGFTGRG